MPRGGTSRWIRLPEPPPEAPSRRGERWSDQDERTVEQYYTTHGCAYTAALLGRTHIAVRHRAQILGVPGFETLVWSDRETTRLKSLFPKIPVEEIARRLKRTEGSVRSKLLLLGLLDATRPEWTAEEDEVLRKRYPGAVKADGYATERRSRAWSVERIAEHLGRTVSSIHSRASYFGLSRFVGERPWTDAEDKRLRRLKRDDVPTGEMARVLRRTKSDIVERMRSLDLLRDMRGWTEAEDDLLRALLGSVDRDEIAARLDRSRNSVNARISTLGIAPPRSPEWTDEDIATLRELFATMPVRDVAQRLGRSVDAVSMKAASLGMKPYVHTSWSAEEDETLRRLYRERLAYREIAARIGRSESSVEGRIHRLGLTRDEPMKPRWSPEEDAQLRALYATHSGREIAAILERSTNAVTLRAQLLGIAPPAPDRYSPDDDEFIRTKYPTMTARDVGRHLGRSQQSVIVRARKLGLRKR